MDSIAKKNVKKNVDEKIFKIIEISVWKANIYALGLIVPVIIFYILFFELIWGLEKLAIINNLFGKIFLLILGVIMHELIHGFFWSIFCKDGFKSISFGFIWKGFAPYAHCKEALKLSYYKLGTVMPLVMLGIIPALLSIIFGIGWLLIYGIIFTLASGGDIIMLYHLSKFDNNKYVIDHPNEIGCIILNEKSDNEAIKKYNL